MAEEKKKQDTPKLKLGSPTRDLRVRTHDGQHPADDRKRLPAAKKAAPKKRPA